MRRIVIVALILLVTTAIFSASKKSPPLASIEVNCSPAVEPGGWRIVGSGSQNVKFEYWGSKSCVASIEGKPATAGAEPLTSPNPSDGPIKRWMAANITSADFWCRGNAAEGKCHFRILEAVTPGNTPMWEMVVLPVGFGCNTVADQTIFDNGSGPRDVVVRAQAPEGCTATVKASTGAVIQLKNMTKFLGFAGASKITVRCEGATTGERCKFEVRAW